MRRILVAAVIACIALPAYGVSFDCSKATSRVEKMVCAEPALSRLDEDIASAYTNALAVSPAHEELRQTQRAWLHKRNACPDSHCLRSAYENQLAYLKGQVPHDHDSPEKGLQKHTQDASQARNQATEREKEDVREKVFHVHNKVGTVRVQSLVEGEDATPVIKIWKQHAQEPFQVIKLRSDWFNVDNLPVIEPGDYNFDGYMDFAVQTDSGPHNSNYDFYVFNKTRGRFEYHDGLSELPNPEFDTVKKRIFAHESMSGRTVMSEEYTFVDHKLIKLWRQEWYDDPKKQDICVWKRWERQHGKLVLIETERGPCAGTTSSR